MLTIQTAQDGERKTRTTPVGTHQDQAPKDCRLESAGAGIYEQANLETSASPMQCLRRIARRTSCCTERVPRNTPMT